MIYVNQILKDKGMTAEDLAQKIKLSKQTIWAYGRGDRNPDPQTLCAIADALDVSLDLLVRGKEKDRSEERSMEGAIKRYENYTPAELEELGALIQYLRYRKERELQQGQASSDTP